MCKTVVFSLTLGALLCPAFVIAGDPVTKDRNAALDRRNSTRPVHRIPPAGEAQQIQLELCAVEMSGQTLRQLGLWTDDKDGSIGKPAADSSLLESVAAWNAALETAARLGAVRVITAPTLVTVSGRPAQIEYLGADFDSDAAKKAGLVHHSIKWSVTPTITKRDEVSIEVQFSLDRMHPLEAASPSGVRPSDRSTKLETHVTIPFAKPVLLGGVIESSDSKDEAKQKMATIIVLSANRIEQKPASKMKDAQK
jgi:hypothetical protein